MSERREETTLKHVYSVEWRRIHGERRVQGFGLGKERSKEMGERSMGMAKGVGRRVYREERR